MDVPFPRLRPDTFFFSFSFSFFFPSVAEEAPSLPVAAARAAAADFGGLIVSCCFTLSVIVGILDSYPKQLIYVFVLLPKCQN
jgi:hypothetical protein